MKESPALICLILAGGWLLLGPCSGHGRDQGALPEDTPALLPSDAAASAVTPWFPTSAKAEASPGPGPSGGRTWSGPPGTTEAKTFWEKVWPTIVPYPRTGNFCISPSGPGTYTVHDFLTGREASDRPKNPYLQWGQNANPFFDVDFRYLDNPQNTEGFLFDSLKRIHLGDDWLFSTGGEVRDRYTSLENAYLYNKRPLAGSDEAFNLFRTRLYGNLCYRDLFCLYAEFISADSSPQRVPHPSSDVDKADILNLFAEVKVLSLGDDGIYVRGGRQELLFGSQRLVSPSDWSNELRTFQGVRGLYHTEQIEEDVFWVQPVTINTGKLDSVDDKQVFTGNYLKYRLSKDTSLDAYYLYLENDNQTFAGRRNLLGGFDVNTFGSRFVGQAGDHDQYLWDFEGAIQFGSGPTRRPSPTWASPASATGSRIYRPFPRFGSTTTTPRALRIPSMAPSIGRSTSYSRPATTTSTPRTCSAGRTSTTFIWSWASFRPIGCA